ncbi:hypothetical protein [Paenibacillus gansuensis]|uniref:Lipoprotein n=1 Tax=Paenibacillus gansuensis TaxID=306542 RepID=A0ABW5PEK2_9BACL
MRLERKRSWKWLPLLMLAGLMLMAAGCGGPKEDVKISVLPQSGIPSEATDKLQEVLAAKLGEKPTMGVYGSPLFRPEKMMVELAAGENSIVITDEELFKGYTSQGGFVRLDDAFDASKFPEGVTTAEEGTTDEPKKVTALYGIPMDKAGWFQAAGLNGKGLFAFIPGNSPDVEQSIRVLKTIVEMK